MGRLKLKEAGNWRTAAFMNTALGVIAIVGGVLLWDHTRNIAENTRSISVENRALLCDIGRLVTVSSVSQQSPLQGETPQGTAKRLRVVQSFRDSLKKVDCRQIGRTAGTRRPPDKGGDAAGNPPSGGGLPGPGEGPNPDSPTPGGSPDAVDEIINDAFDTVCPLSPVDCSMVEDQVPDLPNLP